MKWLFLLLISFMAVHPTDAQEKVAPDSISGILKSNEDKELTTGMPLFMDGSFTTGKINLFDHSLFSQPLLPDFNKSLDFKKHLNFSNLTAESFSTDRLGIYPFYTNGIVFNRAEYKINTRFSFGGNSFGAQSIFDRPGINPSVQNMSTKGASMYMQYKVSKNFKIETKVSVTNHESPWGP